MILYLGTSSLVKMYVDETFSDILREWVQLAEIIATCRLAYTETISGLEIRLRGGDISRPDYEKVLKGFNDDWSRYAVVDFDEHDAGRLVKKYGLRRLDALHLSAALLIKKADRSASVFFSSADEGLNRAASAEMLKVVPFVPFTGGQDNGAE